LFAHYKCKVFVVDYLHIYLFVLESNRKWVFTFLAKDENGVKNKRKIARLLQPRTNKNKLSFNKNK